MLNTHYYSHSTEETFLHYISGNSEADASEFLENIEEMFSRK